MVNFILFAAFCCFSPIKLHPSLFSHSYTHSRLSQSINNTIRYSTILLARYCLQVFNTYTLNYHSTSVYPLLIEIVTLLHRLWSLSPRLPHIFISSQHDRQSVLKPLLIHLKHLFPANHSLTHRKKNPPDHRKPAIATFILHSSMLIDSSYRPCS